MMKILLLNPQINAQHKTAQFLRSKGHALLFATSGAEAIQLLKLHGETIDLGLIHLEAIGSTAPEQDKFFATFRSVLKQIELPIIVSTSTWSDGQCAQHQTGPYGANAYLHVPFSDEQLATLIDTIFKEPSGLTGLIRPNGDFTQTRSVEIHAGKPPAPPKVDTASFTLEDAAQIFVKPDLATASDMGITLEAPSVPEPSRPSPSIEALSVPPSSLPPVPAPVVEAVAEINAAIEISIPPAIEENAPIVLASPSETASEGSQVQAGGIEISIDPAPADIPQFEISAGEPVAFEMPVEPGVEVAPEPESVAPPVHELEPELAPESELVAAATPQETSEAGDLADEMPYLFKQSSKNWNTPIDPKVSFAQPTGEAVVPGGVSHSPDIETLKKYLMLREEDVAVLSTKFKASQEQIANLEISLKEERARGTELTHMVSDHKRRLEDFDRQKSIELSGIEGEANEMKFQLKAKTDKARLLEARVKEAADEIDRLKERVRADIRKIRTREKELENRLEIMKKDSEVLIGARENKIIELKRKLDLLEFNMDLLQDQYVREKENSAKLRELFAKAAQVVRVAGGILETSEPQAHNQPEASSADHKETASKSDSKREAS